LTPSAMALPQQTPITIIAKNACECSPII
jgi:hypothetical protein